MSVQRIVEDAPPIDLQAEAQHASGEVEEPVSSFFLCVSYTHTHFCKKKKALLFSLYIVLNEAFCFLSAASVLAEVRADLPVQADTLGKRRRSVTHDAQRSTTPKPHVSVATDIENMLLCKDRMILLEILFICLIVCFE